MIKRPSRRLITSSLRSDLPLCVNTFDYNASSTDPGEPLPSTVGITINAPAKLAFAQLGTSGFTASSNSYGVTTVAPRLPFSLTNPVRMQFKGMGRVGVAASVPSSTCSSVQVTRQSNSASTVFDTPSSSFQGGQLVQKLVTSGFYLRSNSSYLFAVYGYFGTATSDRSLLFVYAPIKFLPQEFSVRCLRFPTNDYTFKPDDGSPSVTTDVIVSATELSSSFICTTSPQVIDVDNIVMEEFSTYQDDNKTNVAYGVAIGVTSLSFTL